MLPPARINRAKRRAACASGWPQQVLESPFLKIPEGGDFKVSHANSGPLRGS